MSLDDETSSANLFWENPKPPPPVLLEKSLENPDRGGGCCRGERDRDLLLGGGDITASFAHHRGGVAGGATSLFPRLLGSIQFLTGLRHLLG